MTSAATAEYAPELSEPIIHRIQTLLSTQKAPETTLLSKSWFRAWSTRRTIDLDESHFQRDYSSYPEIAQLAVFAKKTFRRYKHHNLKIDTFILSLKTKWYWRSGLPTKWTFKALKLGATNFTFRSQSHPRPDIVLPIHALLGSENTEVRRLCLDNACIDRLKVVRCMGLKTLALTNMQLTSDSFHDMISCCPLIENLSLSYIYWTEPRAGSMITLHNLTSLNLFDDDACQFQIFFGDNGWLSRFPNLKDLTLRLSVYDASQIPVIASASVETLNLTLLDGHTDAELEIDLPRILKFTFEGSLIKLTFSCRSKSRDEFESHVSLINCDDLSAMWFYKLGEFLTSMAGSKIRLSLYVRSTRSFDYLPGDIGCSSACELEDLTMDMSDLPSLSLYAVLDVLFRICRPKMITQYVSPPGKYYPMSPLRTHHPQYMDSHPRKNDAILFRALGQGMKEKGSLLPSQCMYGLLDLEELNAQKFCNESWMPQPFDSVGDQKGRFRFQLKWKQSIVDRLS